MKALPHCKNMKNITIMQKNIKNRKNMKNTKYMGWGGSLWKPQLHWLLLLLRLLPLKTVQYLPWRPSPLLLACHQASSSYNSHKHARFIQHAHFRKTAMGCHSPWCFTCFCLSTKIELQRR